MSEETPTNPVDGEATAAPTAGVDGQSPAPSDDIDTDAFDRMPAPVDDDGDTTAADTGAGDKPASEADKPAEIEEEEVELSDGRKVKVPKEVALGNLRQADYTQKTQAVAEQARALEQERSAWQAQQAESLKTFRQEHVAIATAETQLGKIEEDLSKYRQMTPADWAALKAQDPDAYRAHTDNLEILRNSKISLAESLEDAKKTLTAKEAAAKEASDKAQAEAIAEGFQKAEAILTKDIPGWNKQRWGEVAQFVEKELGVTAEELQKTTDPRTWKMADRLMKAEAELAKLKSNQRQQTAAQTQERAQTSKPAEKPAGNAPPRGVSDQLDTDAWMKRREAQLARKQAAR